METIKGFVENIIYRNNDNGYTVFEIELEEEDLTCVGSFPDISVGEHIELTGEFVEHRVYGRQFSAKSYKITQPEDAAQIEKYLGSGAIKGIGPALAARIVKKFEDDTIRIIEEEPERLAEIKGISVRLASKIAEQVMALRQQRNAMMYLQQYNITTNLAVRLYGEYGEKIYEILSTNPYKLSEDLNGIGFKTADEIAQKVGIERDSRFRIQSGILYALLDASSDGHTFLPEEELTNRAGELLGVSKQAVEDEYMDLIVEHKLVRKQDETGDKMYSTVFYAMEHNVAVMLKSLCYDCDEEDDEIEKSLEKIQKNLGIELDEMQVKAVKNAVGNGVFILTGGPGTGKTTTINTMIKYFSEKGLDIRLAAPTGRAAKRMSEMTGREAKTIHRLLELNGDAEGAGGFGRDEDNPLETDVIIIDEMSMVDIALMNSLLKAIVPGTRLILVGDTNQLPSVGPGSVLKDIIASGIFSTVTLNKIFRQAKESDIIVNAHRINNGEPVELGKKSMDFFFLKEGNVQRTIEDTIKLVRDNMPKYVNASSFDVQVLTPTKKGELGIENLNKKLQKALNPPSKDKREKEHGDKIFREGDKVMQTKNNYQLEWEVCNDYGIPVEKGLGIFNGDMGIIREINTFSEQMKIEFDDGRFVDYDFKLLDDIEHAYAITVHKSQGSEYPAVVIPLFGGPRMLLNRNILYTAITRAKQCVVLLGNPGTFVDMETNVSQQKRYSGLVDRINEL
ncbi:MAG: ATP-dependent RecD-like DNA helicase [Eubacterium sp.]|nr:ATP-dependent RecD-like DNA helicase [Eubacterium sp.]